MTLTTRLGYTPAFQINKSGSDITASLADRVVSLQVKSGSGGGENDSLDLLLDDRNWTLDTPITDGEGQATLDLYLGYTQSGLYEQGSFAIGEVTLLGNPKSMRLKGSSIGFQSYMKAPIITAHDGQTVQQIIETIAGAAGLSSVVDPNIGSQVVNFYNQHSSSMHVVQDLERKYNGLAKIQNGMLSFTNRGTGQAASGELAGPFVIEADDLGSWTFTISDRTSYSQVKAGWFDRDAQQLRWLTNTAPTGGQSGVPFLMKTPFPSEAEAQRAADAQANALRRGLVRGNLTLSKGAPMIHGGAAFAVVGCKPSMNGAYLVTTANHTYTKDGGIQTTIEFTNVTADIDLYPALAESNVYDALGVKPDDLRPVTPGGA